MAFSNVAYLQGLSKGELRAPCFGAGGTVLGNEVFSLASCTPRLPSVMQAGREEETNPSSPKLLQFSRDTSDSFREFRVHKGLN